LRKERTMNILFLCLAVLLVFMFIIQHQVDVLTLREDLPNLSRVSDELYRGGQPSVSGFKELKYRGVKTVINLRLFHSDQKEIEGTGLNYVHIPMTGLILHKRSVFRFLGIVMDSEMTPVFVHCRGGADRAGTMVAVYRIFVQGWAKEEAIGEMTNGKFGTFRNIKKYLWFSHRNGVYKHVIRKVRRLDAPGIRAKIQEK